ncbi:MAG TPA: ABC transporter ATP-binding protein [Acidimicrobiales bacterium]|jgi:branched-chain amino acid transport system ATP-binding protein
MTETAISGGHPRVSSEPPILAVSGLEVVYNDVIRVLHGVSVGVPAGAIVAILGANGAGKTTLLRAITGLLDHHRGEIVKGKVFVDGHDVTRSPPSQIVRLGVAQVMEGRRSFAELSVDDNLRAGAVTVKDRQVVKDRMEQTFEMFPVLADRRRSIAGYLSGGEQQMLVIGRALMSGPRLLLLDEPTLGLAPLIAQQIAGIIGNINADGTSVLLVEQNATMALSLASHGYVMETGRIVRDGPGDELLADEDIREFYLGVGGGHSRSYRNVKTYRRRRRWA